MPISILDRLGQNQRTAVYATQTGRLELEAELDWLWQLRRQAVAERKEALARYGPGDRLVAARCSEVAALEREASHLGATLRRVVMLPDPTSRVGVGSRVRLQSDRGERLVVTIVGLLAANPCLNLISYESALGRALMGQVPGATIEVKGDGEPWKALVLATEDMALHALGVGEPSAAVVPVPA